MPDPGPLALLRSAGVSDPSQVSPGLPAFLVFFGLALATVLLVRSMVGHLRKVRYGPGGPDEVAVRPLDPDAGSGAGSSAEAGGERGSHPAEGPGRPGS